MEKANRVGGCAGLSSRTGLRLRGPVGGEWAGAKWDSNGAGRHMTEPQATATRYQRRSVSTAAGGT